MYHRLRFPGACRARLGGAAPNRSRSESRGGAAIQGSGKDIVLNNRIDRPYTVAPSDLLSLFIRSAIIRDSHLKDSAAALGYFGGDLWLKTEAVFLDYNTSEQFPPECLVAGF